MAVVKLQKLLSSAKRCVFESNEIYIYHAQKKSCKHLYAVCVEMRVKIIPCRMKLIQLECFRCYNSFQWMYRSTTTKNGLYRRAELRTNNKLLDVRIASHFTRRY